MRYTATLTGAASMAPAFGEALDDVVDGVVLGDESTSIVTLVYDVFAWTKGRARERAADVVRPLIEAASSNGQHLHLGVERGRR